jgi:hypothetical protein
MHRQQRMFELAQRIHQLLVDHCESTHSQDESTCALRMAGALWTESPRVYDASSLDQAIGSLNRAAFS